MSERRGRRRVRAGEEESVRGAGHPDPNPDPSQLLQSLTSFPLNLKFNSCNFFINTACTPPITFDPHQLLQAIRPSRGRTPTRRTSYHRNRLSSRSSSERNWSRRRSRSNSHHHRRRRSRSNSHHHRRRHRSNSHHRRMRRSSSSSYSGYSDSSSSYSGYSDSSSSDIVREQPILYSRSPSPYRSLVRDDSLDEHYSRSPNHFVSRSMSPLKARSRSRTPAGNHLHSPERSPSPT